RPAAQGPGQPAARRPGPGGRRRPGRPRRHARRLRPRRDRAAAPRRAGRGGPPGRRGRAVRPVAVRAARTGRADRRPPRVGQMTGTPLDRYPLFRLLSPWLLGDWLAAGQDVDCPSGMTLFQENTPGAWVHAVLARKVRIVRPSGRREISLGMFLPGDAFGEYALLRPGNKTATCRPPAHAALPPRT